MTHRIEWKWVDGISTLNTSNHHDLLQSAVTGKSLGRTEYILHYFEREGAIQESVLIKRRTRPLFKCKDKPRLADIAAGLITYVTISSRMVGIIT